MGRFMADRVRCDLCQRQALACGCGVVFLIELFSFDYVRVALFGRGEVYVCGIVVFQQ